MFWLRNKKLFFRYALVVSSECQIIMGTKLFLKKTNKTISSDLDLTELYFFNIFKTLCLLETPRTGTFANSKDPNETSHLAVK